MLDGKALSAAEIAQIADLESREVLLAKLAGGLKALPTRAAGLFQAPLAQVARLAKALEEKKSAGDTTVAPEVDGPYAENVDTADPDPVGEAAAEAAAAENAPPAEPAE